jgi:hypothetical protein
MPHRTHDSPRASPPGYPDTPASVSDEQLARSDRGKLFTEDGRKVRDIARVGAMAPDTDPPDSPPPPGP